MQGYRFNTGDTCCANCPANAAKLLLSVCRCRGTEQTLAALFQHISIQLIHYSWKEIGNFTSMTGRDLAKKVPLLVPHLNKRLCNLQQRPRNNNNNRLGVLTE